MSIAVLKKNLPILQYIFERIQKDLNNKSIIKLSILKNFQEVANKIKLVAKNYKQIM